MNVKKERPGASVPRVIDDLASAIASEMAAISGLSSDFGPSDSQIELYRLLNDFAAAILAEARGEATQFALQCRG